MSVMAVAEEGAHGAAGVAAAEPASGPTRGPSRGVGAGDSLAGHLPDRVALDRLLVQPGCAVPDPHAAERGRYFQRNYLAAAGACHAAVLCWVNAPSDIVHWQTARFEGRRLLFWLVPEVAGYIGAQIRECRVFLLRVVGHSSLKQQRSFQKKLLVPGE